MNKSVKIKNTKCGEEMFESIKWCLDNFEYDTEWYLTNSHSKKANTPISENSVSKWVRNMNGNKEHPVMKMKNITIPIVFNFEERSHALHFKLRWG